MNGFGTYLLVDRLTAGVASRPASSAVSARHARRVAVAVCLLALAAACLCGCAVAAPADEVIPDVEPTPHVEPSTSPIVMTVAPSSYAEIINWLGESNSVTLERAHQINHSEIGLSLAANTRVTWVTGPTATQFTFAPSPKITSSAVAKILGLTLSGLEIRSDGSGTATVSGGIHRGFRWDGNSPTGASMCPCGCGQDACRCSSEASGPRSTSALPEVILYSRDGCSGCVTWEKGLAGLKEKPFSVRVIKSPPAWVKVVPFLHWNDSRGNGRQQPWDDKHPNGWSGAEAFVETWKKSQK